LRAVIQRVSSARVEVDARPAGAIEEGLLVFLGVAADDDERDVEWLASKVAELRVFEDSAGKMNRSVEEAGGALLVVSQFTLLGDCRKGRRPSFDAAAPPERAEALYLRLVNQLRGRGLRVETGVFRAYMAVSLVNDGPVTLLLDSRKTF
jgi:D-tyrosyl-tRNA(Tyr) deacylase